MWYTFQALPNSTELQDNNIMVASRINPSEWDTSHSKNFWFSGCSRSNVLQLASATAISAFLNIYFLCSLGDFISYINNQTIKNHALLSRRLTCHLSKLSSIHAHIDQHITYEQNPTINRSQILVINTKIHYITQCKERLKIPESIITQNNQRTAIFPTPKNNGLLKGRFFLWHRLYFKFLYSLPMFIILKI